MLVSLLNRYIHRHLLKATGLVVLVLAGLESFLELISQLADIGKGHFGILQAIYYVPLQLPTDLYQLLPMACLLSSLIGLGHLARTHQLTAIRSSGYSVLQLIGSVIQTGCLILLFATVTGEYLAPLAQQKAAQLKTAALSEQAMDSARGALKNIWLKHQNTYLHIDAISTSHTMSGITRLDFDQHQLKRIIQAKKGIWLQGGWQLRDIQETRFLDHHTSSQFIQFEPLNITLHPSSLLRSIKEKEIDTSSIKTLLHNISFRHDLGLNTQLYEYALWRRILQPLTTLVMLCLGIPFVFGSPRSSLGHRIMTGSFIGFACYMAHQFLGPITLMYAFPPALAAALPTGLLLLTTLILLKRST